MPFCHLQLITEPDMITVGPTPEALWGVCAVAEGNPDELAFRYRLRPPHTNPFGALARAGQPDDRLFFLAGRPGPFTFYNAVTQGDYLIAPPVGNECPYWDAQRDRSPTCPSAATCPYRQHLVRFRQLRPEEVPAAAARLPPIDGPAKEVPAGGWNLFPVTGTAGSRQSELPAVPSHPWVTTLPAVYVPPASDVFFSPLATRLRSALLAQRPTGARLRADLSVAAADLPGAREAGWLLDAIDLTESFPPMRSGDDAPPAYRAVVRAYARENQPIWAWARAVGVVTDDTGTVVQWQTPKLPAVLANWFGEQFGQRLRSVGLEGVNWILTRGRSRPERYPPDNPGPAFYTSEPPTADPGACLEAVLAALEGHLTGQSDSAGLLDQLRAVVGDGPGRLRVARATADLFGLVLGRVPGHFLRPPGRSFWPGELFDWWVLAQPVADGPAVAAHRRELLSLLATRAARLPIRAVGRRIGRYSPLRFVLGHSKLATNGGASKPLAGRDWSSVIDATEGPEP